MPMVSRVWSASSPNWPEREFPSPLGVAKINGDDRPKAMELGWLVGFWDEFLFLMYYLSWMRELQCVHSLSTFSSVFMLQALPYRNRSTHTSSWHSLSLLYLPVAISTPWEMIWVHVWDVARTSWLDIDRAWAIEQRIQRQVTSYLLLTVEASSFIVNLLFQSKTILCSWDHTYYQLVNNQAALLLSYWRTTGDLTCCVSSPQGACFSYYQHWCVLILGLKKK